MNTDRCPLCRTLPIGVCPKYIWLHQRKNELAAAIRRYLDAGIEVPAEWIAEYNEIVKDGSK